jgi:glycosyltransferase involved in cell wall biosynthesis
MEELSNKLMTKISVVIPVLNESSLIDELIRQIGFNVELVSSDYEIVIVDDGSEDNTWELIESESRKNQKLKAIRLSRNFGHHYAITAGLDYAKGEWVVVMDGDLQDRPDVIPALYNKALEGFDIVFVARKDRKDSKSYLLLQRIYYLTLKLISGIKFDHRIANFSIINRKVVNEYINMKEQLRFYPATIKWLGFSSTNIVADHGERFSGTPSYTFKKRLKLAIDIILAFSERPLKFAIYGGLGISASTTFIVIVIIARKLLFGVGINGWTSIILAFLFLSGIIITMLGIISLYISKIYNQVKERPLYIIDKSENFEK